MRLEPRPATPLTAAVAAAARAHGPMLLPTIAVNVLGWPLLLGLAVRHVDAMHASVITGLMPLATAAVGALVLGQRPSAGFSAFALLGAAPLADFPVPVPVARDLRARRHS